MEGWIKLHRRILDWEWFDDDATFKVFVWLLLNANREPQTWHGVPIGRGQIMTSIEKISKATNHSVRNIRTIIDRLKSTSELTVKSTNKFSIITICNYDSYQCSESDERQAERQASSQSSDKHNINKKEKNKENNILPPYIPPRGDCEPACENFMEEAEVVPNHDTTQTALPLNDTASPLEKEKSSAKKEKEPKHKYGQFENVLLTDKEAQKLHDEYGDDAIGIVEHLSAYKAEKNYKTKSDYLTIKRWVVSAYYEHQKRNSYGNIRTSVSDIPTERIVEAGRAWANI